MYCVKTGARLYIEELGSIVSADIYQVGETTLVAKWNPGGYWNDSYMTINEARISPIVTHIATTPESQRSDWCRDDVGVLVTDRSLLSGHLCG